MIHLVLDTSIFRGDRNRVSPAFKALTRLLQAQKVILHLPEWVKREVVSQLQEDARAKLAALSSAAKALRDVNYVNEVVEFSKDLQGRIAELNTLVTERHAKSLEGWLSSCRVVEHPANPHHVTHLIDAYFTGAPPFSKAKNREDIPDALIWQSVLDILKDGQPLHIVVADKRFKSCAESVTGISAFERLSEFIQSEPCQEALGELDEENVFENSFHAISLLAQDRDAVIDEIRDKIELQLKEYQFHDEEIPTSDQAARILRANRDDNVNIEFDLAEYYGDGVVQIPFSAPFTCRIQYTIPIGLYEELPRGRMEGADIIESNPFTYLAEQEAYINVLGMLNVTFNTECFREPNISENELLNEVGRAKLDVEVQDLTILDLL